MPVLSLSKGGNFLPNNLAKEKRPFRVVSLLKLTMLIIILSDAASRPFGTTGMQQPLLARGGRVLSSFSFQSVSS